MKSKLYRLTIFKALDRKSLVNTLSNIFDLTLAERFKIVDNLPFIDEDMWSERDHVINALTPYCEFLYEQIPFPGNENVSTPPWESPQYISAKNWYHTLSEEDRKKIDILVSGNVAWA